MSERPSPPDAEPEPKAATKAVTKAAIDASTAPAAEDAPQGAGVPRPSSFQQWRKRLGPLVLFLGVTALIHETCKANDRREVTVRLDLGAAAPRVQHLWVDVFVEGESVAQYQRVGGISLPPELPAHLSGESAELRVDVALAPEPPETEPLRKVITRRIRAEGGSTLTIPLGDDLAR